MSEEKKTKWFSWAKNLVSAIVGAVISCAATIGVIGKSDADNAKQKVDAWLQKSETAYTQVVTVGETISEVKKLIEEKKYLEALGKLDTIKDNAVSTIATIKELKEEISEAVKAAKEKADEVKETVQSAAADVKEAVGTKPVEEKPAE